MKRIAPVVLLFVATFAAFSPVAWLVPTAAVHSAADFSVYADALAANWQNWSWGSTLNFASNNPVHGGSAALRVKHDSAWAGASLRAPNPINTSDYAGVGFWVNGNGSPVRFYIQSSDGGGESTHFSFTAPLGAWTQYTVTWAQLGNPSAVARLTWQEGAGSVPAAYSLDEVVLIGSGGAGPTPVPTTPSSSGNAEISVDASVTASSLPPTLLGSNLPAWLGPTVFNSSKFRARVQASGATVLRIPGGSWSDDYGWLSCEMGQNVAGAVPCNWNWAAKPTDFINVIRAINSPAMYVMNANVTAGEAAAAVAFFNSYITDTTVIGTDIRGTNWYTAGHWAKLRADHGNVQPLGIKLWEIGNEIYGGKPGNQDCVSYGWETTWTCDGTQYINGVGSGASRREGYLELRAAMRAVDPSIQVGAVGHESPTEYANWMTEVIAAGGSVMDFVSIHPYAYFIPPANTSEGFAQILAKPQAHYGPIKTTLQNLFASRAAGRNIPLYATEFNVVAAQDQDNGQLLTRMVNALFVADSIGQMIVHGYAGANQWDIMNGAAGNGTDYGLLKNDAEMTRSPQYYAYVLWRRFGGAWLPVSNSANAASTLSVYAGWHSPGTMSLLAINKTSGVVTGKINITGAGGLAGGVADMVTAGSLSAQSAVFNGQANPNDDLSNAPSQSVETGTGNSFNYAFAPNSITLLRLNVNGASATALPAATTTPTPMSTATPTPMPSVTPSPTSMPTATGTQFPTATATELPSAYSFKYYIPNVMRNSVSGW